jgi:hypothetical protein
MMQYVSVRKSVAGWAIAAALVVGLVAYTGFGGTGSAIATNAAPAVVEKLDITSRKPAFAGQTFGKVGTYEFIAGVATVRVDPKNPANRDVVDLDKAVEADGYVRFQTDVVILRPTDAARASHALIVDIANRGNKLAMVRLADGALQYDTAAQAGQGWPMRQGHSFAWIGWQSDVPLGKEGQLVGTRLPVAKNGTAAITGRSMEEFVFDKAADKSVGELTYAAATQDVSKATLTVRATAAAAPTTLPSSAWRFVSDRKIEITHAEGFDAGAIYQFTYEARDPVVAGLGMVALRDVTAFLKSGAPDGAGQANPLADIRPNVSILFGISQSGRFLRDFIWYGFNEAADGGKIFDGAMPLIAGSRKSYVNARFAQPGRFSRQHEDHVYYGDQFPFSYATITDPISGRTDGIFARCEKSNTCPKLMQLDSNLEFWQARASLVVTDGLGHPIPVPDNVRLYLMASTQHGPAVKPEAGICQLLNNPAAQAPLARAAMARLIEWARDGKTPPASRYPMAGHGLVEPQQAAIGFPDLSGLGVQFPKVFNTLTVVNYGTFPPQPDAAKSYKILLPRTDKDGHDIDGVRSPEIEVPLATHSGWGLRKAGFGEGDLCGLNGIYVPFAKDAAERAARNDPRPSLAERYASKSAYLEKFKAAAVSLSKDGLLLDEDVERLTDRASKDPRIAGLPD